ncbi:MAG: hypothetical protein ACFFDD_04835 [Promethearchaeota archaeon]
MTSKEMGIKRIRFRGSLRVLGNDRISGNAINVPVEKREAFYLFYLCGQIEFFNRDKRWLLNPLMNVFESNIFKPTNWQRYPDRVR